jgi:uncharacterized protein
MFINSGEQIMKHIFAAALVTLSFAMPGAYAQTAAPAAAQLDPATATAAKEFMDAMKFRDTMQLSLAQMERQLPQIMLQGATSAIQADPKLNAAQKKDAIASMTKELPEAAKAVAATMNDPKLMDEMADAVMPLYAKHFSADELRAMTAFYRSPVGAKMVRTMPQLMGESMQISQRVVMPRVMATIQKLMPAKK